MNWKFMMLVVAVAVMGLGAVAMAEDSEAATGDVLASGNCGTSLTYEVRSLNADDSQVELVIDGSGAMTDYATIADAPWDSFRSSMRNVMLPDEMIRIGDNAFYNCKNLTINHLPSALESVGYRSLAYTNIPITELPTGLTSIGAHAFYFAKNLRITELPTGLTSIGSNAFNATDIAIHTIPDGVITIEVSTFAQCRSIRSLTLPSGLTTIGGQAFDSDTSLTIEALPSGLTSIGNGAFSGCTNLALTSLPESLTTIGESAFNRCTSLALTSLPSGLTVINKGAFANCTSLALTSLPESITEIQGGTYAGAFYNCTSLALTSLPESLTKIGDYAFYGCASLAISSIPIGVVRIGYNAFEKCTTLTEIEILNNTISILPSAFKNCNNLKDVTMPALYPVYDTGMTNLENLCYSTSKDYTQSDVKNSPQYQSRATLQSITFASDYIPTNALYGQNLDTLTITNASGDDVIGIYTSPTTRATTEDLTVTGTAAYIVRLTDLYGNAELLDGGITTNDVTVGWNTTPQGYATGPVDASPEVLVYPAKLGEESPYSMLFSLIPLFAVLALLLSVVYAFSTYAKREGAL